MLIPLHEADGRCGTKAANLGRLLREGFDVPAGFVVADPIGDDSWGLEIESALLDLDAGWFAVRSCGFAEDGRQVAGNAVPVMVQVMVEPEVAGVLFTRHPVSGADLVVIEAAGGLGDEVVDGTVTPQTWTVDGGGITGPGPAEAPVLTSGQVLALGQLGRRIEAIFGLPQDIEWAIADQRIWILQARPITTRPGEARPDEAKPGEVLLTGTPASPGIAHGPVRVITGLDDFEQFRPGDVLVCRTTSPAWTPLLARATAVVTEIGGMLAHAAIVAREFGIPAVVAATGAMTTLADGQQVVVDGSAGTVTAPTNAARNR